MSKNYDKFVYFKKFAVQRFTVELEVKKMVTPVSECVAKWNNNIKKIWQPWRVMELHDNNWKESAR